MPPSEDIQRYLAGAWQLMMGRSDGERLLDTSADGFWTSFFAMVVAFPALAIGWVGYSAEIGGASRLATVAGLAVADLATWIVPIALLAAVARPLGLAPRFVPYVVASNWGAVILLWLLVPGELLRLLAGASQIADAIALIVFFATMVLSWRLTNAILGMGAAIASAVFIGMVAVSIIVMLSAQSLFGLLPPP